MRDGWTETTLGNVALVNPKEDPLAASDPFVPMDAVKVGERWVTYSEPRGDRSGARARAGDVLYARITPCLENGKVAQVPAHLSRCGGSTEFIVLRETPLVLNAYLYLWSTSENVRQSATRLMTGTTGRQRLAASDLASLEFLLPPLNEQRRIVDLIESIDAYIASLRSEIDAIWASRAALLADHFEREGGSAVVLNDLLVRSIGGVWGADGGADEVDVTVVRSTEFTSHGILRYQTGVRRSISRRQLESRELRHGDILLEKSGGGPEQPVGRVVFVPDGIPSEFVCSNFVQLISPDPSRVEPRYLFLLMWLWHRDGRTLQYQAQTTGIRNLRTPDYLSQEIRLPDLTSQRRLVDLISSLDSAHAAACSGLERAVTLRGSLLSELLTGDHEIPSSYDDLLETV